MHHRIKVFFDNKRGVRVTNRVFSTRMRDEDLNAIISVKIGRDPLYIMGITGLALALFAYQFGDLLYPDEQLAMLFGGAVLLAGGYSLVSMTVGTIFNEKSVWWNNYWTAQKVRKAIRDAKHVATAERAILTSTKPVVSPRQ